MNACQSKLVCFRWKQKHHVSICEQDDRNSQNNSNYINDANENAENSAQNVSSSSVNFGNAQNNVILLQTAEALISSKNNNREEKLHILFDTWAQSSFINKEISEKLNLPFVRKEWRIIQTFEDKNVEPRILNVVQAKIKSVHNCKFVNLELFVVPKICSPTANQMAKVAKTTYEHLANLTLTENSPTNENLNINIEWRPCSYGDMS